MSQQKKQPKLITRDETLANTFSWVMMAQAHMLSANILFEKYKSRMKPEQSSSPHWLDASPNVIYMLYGFAIENLVKGFLIAQGVEPFVDKSMRTSQCKKAEAADKETSMESQLDILTDDAKRQFNPDLKIHKLNKLFRVAGLALTEDDAELLEFLSDAIESGKYPIDLKARIRPFAFPYVSKRSSIDIRQHIIETLKRVENEMRNYLILHKQWSSSRLLINLDLGMESYIINATDSEPHKLWVNRPSIGAVSSSPLAPPTDQESHEPLVFAG